MQHTADVGSAPQLTDADIRERIANGRRCLLCREDRRRGGTLCWSHHDELGRILDPDYLGDRDLERAASIPVLWERLDPNPTVSGLADRRAPGFASEPPCRLDVIVMRDRRSVPWEVVEVWYEPLHPGVVGVDDLANPHYEDAAPRPVETSVAGLADAVWEALGYDDLWGSLGWHPAPPVRSVAEHCRWLHTHLHQLTAADDAADLFRDLAELHDQLRPAAGDPKPRPVADCTGWVLDPVTREKVECGAPLYLPPPRPGVDAGPARPPKLDPTKPALRCGRCDRPYTHLMLLRQQVDAQRKVPA